jgi:hypothetical protein
VEARPRLLEMMASAAQAEVKITGQLNHLRDRDYVEQQSTVQEAAQTFSAYKSELKKILQGISSGEGLLARADSALNAIVERSLKKEIECNASQATRLEAARALSLSEKAAIGEQKDRISTSIARSNDLASELDSLPASLAEAQIVRILELHKNFAELAPQEQTVLDSLARRQGRPAKYSAAFVIVIFWSSRQTFES